MSELEPSILIKRGAKRTVSLVPEESLASADTERGAARVVKRFHSPGRIDRFFDRGRAEQEHALLLELARRGLPVPRPIELARRDGAWELVTEWIPGAMTLDEVLCGRVRLRVEPAHVAAAFGRLLARAHAVGLDHQDLHPGNLMLQEDGQVWLVDVRSARLRASIGAKTALRDLVALAAATRERTDEAARTCFLGSYLRAAGAARAAALGAQRFRAGLAARIEELARLRRRAVIERGRLRWTRASSVCRPIEPGPGGLAGFVASALDPERQAAVLDLARAAVNPARERRALLPLSGGDGLVVRLTGPWNEVRNAWHVAARLFEHALPAAEPALLLRAPLPAAYFLLPAGSRGLPDALRSHEGAARIGLASALGTLDGSLRDRGLSIRASDREALYVGRDGRLSIAAPAHLSARTGPTTRSSLIDLLAPPSEGERSRFETAFLAAQRAGARDRAALRHAFEQRERSACQSEGPRDG